MHVIAHLDSSTIHINTTIRYTVNKKNSIVNLDVAL